MPSPPEAVRTALATLATAVLTGSAAAVFLTGLAWVTGTRADTPWLPFLLPGAGFVLGWIWHRWGAPVADGANQVVRRGQERADTLPARMAPMVVLGTWATHLFGGSAGREGTAVQMGASLADTAGRWCRVDAGRASLLIHVGIAAGFGAVFGTPFAGALFALESIQPRRPALRHALPALLAALFADAVCHAWGADHDPWPTLAPVVLTPSLFLRWLVLGTMLGGVARLFLRTTTIVRTHSRRWLPALPWRMAAGGAAVVLLWQAVGTDDYLGLGVPVILRSFEGPVPGAEVWGLKLVFTALTVGTGFVGGEVTPLFFMGATAAAWASPWLGVPQAMAAGAGVAAVFGAAARAPLALVVMAAELMGVAVIPHALPVVLAARVVCGRQGLWEGQKEG